MPAAPNPKIVAANPVPRDILWSLLSASSSLKKRLGISGWTREMFEENEIGHGHYARVFALPEWRVLKLTVDPDDAGAAEVIRRAGKPIRGLVEVFEVSRLPGHATNEFLGARLGDPGPVFAIVTERVEPVRHESKYEDAAIVLVTVASFWPPGDPEKALRFLAHGDDNRAAVARPGVSDLVHGWRWLVDHGYRVSDISLANVGMSDRGEHGELVLFDFGHQSRQVMQPAEQIQLAENSRSPLPRTRRSFDRHFDEAENRFPDLGTIELHHDDKAGSDNGVGADRQFGYCVDGKPIRIAFAAKTEELTDSNLDGLMAHEWGHVLDYRYGKRELERLLKKRLPDGVERRADAIAEIVFGKTIKYDEKDVQCVSCRGQSPRPKRLGP